MFTGATRKDRLSKRRGDDGSEATVKERASASQRLTNQQQKCEQHHHRWLCKGRPVRVRSAGSAVSRQ